MPLTGAWHFLRHHKSPRNATSDVIIRIFPKRGRSKHHPDVKSGKIDLILLRIGSKWPVGAYWTESSARLPTVPQTLNGGTHCHPLFRNLLNKGQALLGIAFPIPGLLQLAVKSKRRMSWSVEPQAVQNSQDPISQIAGASVGHPSPESRALTPYDFRFSGNPSDRAERESTLEHARSNRRTHERDSDSYCG